MKSLLAALTAGVLLANIVAAQRPQYVLNDLGLLPGGSFSLPGVISNDGIVTGVAGARDGTQHALIWLHTQTIDIGVPALGGKNSSAFGEAGGVVVGQAELPENDPNHENFCGFGTDLKCSPFRWSNGLMTPLLLPPGGNNGQAGPINAQGEILGTVENGTVDPECPPGISLNGITGPQLLHFEGVVWGPNGQISRELKPLPQDSVSTAVWMNDQGQAVGASGRCGNTALPPFAFGPHAVLWSKDGTPQDLGNLGYATQNIGLAVNNVGQVVGASATGPDSTPVNGVHAFYWTHETGMQDLGTLDGDLASGATGINDAGEVIGISIDPNGILSAVVWQNGTIHDLNELIPRSPLYLAFAASINNVGQIAGWGIHKGNGEMHAFVATPTLTASPASVNDGPLQRMPEGFEKLMRGRRGFRRQ